MAHAVEAEIGARSRVVGAVALGAIGSIAAIDRSGLGLRLGDGAADDGAGGETDRASCGSRAVITAIIAARIRAAIIPTLHVARTAAIITRAAVIAAILNVVGLNLALLEGGNEFVHRRGLRLGGRGRCKADSAESGRCGQSHKEFTHGTIPPMSGSERGNPNVVPFLRNLGL